MAAPQIRGTEGVEGRSPGRDGRHGCPADPGEQKWQKPGAQAGTATMTALQAREEQKGKAARQTARRQDAVLPLYCAGPHTEISC